MQIHTRRINSIRERGCVCVRFTHYFAPPAPRCRARRIFDEGSFRILGQSLLSAVSSRCLSSRRIYIYIYSLYARLRKLQSHVHSGDRGSLQLVKGEFRGEKIPGVFRNISTRKCIYIYTGVHFASLGAGELPHRRPPPPLAFHIDFYQS